MIQGLCQLLVSSGGYEGVWVALTDKTGRIQSWATEGLGESEALFFKGMKNGKTPPCLLREGPPALPQMLDEECRCEQCPMGNCSWRQRALIAPLMWHQKRFGAMAVIMPRGICFNEDEALLVEEVASELSHRLHEENLEEERRLSDEGLQESRRSMETLLTNLPGMAYRCTVDDSWTMHLVSAGALPLTGYLPDELMGNRVVSFEDLIHPMDKKRVKETVLRAIETEEAFEVEYRIYTRLGEEKWVWERGTPIKEAGHTAVVECFITDITKRRKVKEDLQLSNMRYRTLVEDMPAMVCRFEPDGRLTDINKSYCRMFGRSRRELLGQNFFLFLPKGVRDAVRYRFLSFTPQEPMATTEHEVIMPDGSVGWQEWTNRAIFSKSGEIREFQAIGRDVTQRRLAEEALRKNEQKYRAYLHNSPVGIFVIDDEGRYVEANTAACSMLGYSRQELLTKKVTDLAHVDEEKDLVQAHLDQLKYQGKLRTEVCFMHKEGGYIYGILEAVTLELGLYMAYFIDQTEQRVLQSQLQQVQKIESVGRLAAGVSHDFNNMLSPILGYAELLLEELEPGQESYGYALEVKNAAERSRNLVRQLLAFSRKQVLSLDTLDLREIIIDMEVLLRRTLREDIVVDYTLDELACLVQADAGQVEQILMNLSVNAQDAMAEGGRLTISCLREVVAPGHHLTQTELLPGEYVVLKVSDTGVGMDPHTKDHALEPFFSTKGKGGTGLGLSTVYGIVKQHGGSLVMDSQPGQGTIFTLYFPITDGEPAPMPSRKLKPRSQHGSETLLLAEDNEVVKNMASSVLVRQGYTVHKASSGEEALMLLESLKGKVDLLLTDVIMPGMNGRELYTKVAQRFPKVQVVYMSGYSDDVIAHHGVLEDGIHFIQKPFTIEGLTTKVREVLNHS
ncbi:MAG: PAS domain S-box protein [Desulfobacterales bacterium]|nr:PAS domain S-box protein [Desulfobacterales bacterium]